MNLSASTLLRKFQLLAICISLLPAVALAGAYEDFFGAVKADNAREIRSLLGRGLGPNLTEAERGDTGLILALREDAMNVFNVLVNARGINLNAKSNNGDNAMMIAAYKGNLPAVEALVAKGAGINRPNWTALHYAAASGSEEIVALLISKGADLNALSPNKTTPLMMAAADGHILTVKLLLDSGADAMLRNDAGMNAIDIATKFNHKDIAEGLIYRLKRAGKM